MINAGKIMFFFFLFLGRVIINPHASLNTVTNQWIKDPNVLKLGMQWPPLTVIKFTHNESHSPIP